MMSVMPDRNKTYKEGHGCQRLIKQLRVHQNKGLTFPRASNAPSKKSTTPRNKNSTPNVVKATPISVRNSEPRQSRPGYTFMLTLSIREPHIPALMRECGGLISSYKRHASNSGV
jgi:hypothetical protein